MTLSQELITGALALLFGAGGYWWLVKRYPEFFTRPNFLGRTIPSSAGMACVLAADFFYTIVWLAPSSHHAFVGGLCLLISTAFGCLGLADDLYGNRLHGGLRGHFQVLLKQGRLTTGAAKALGGVGISVVAAHTLFPTNALQAFVAALCIALSSNALNLLDTRPGRALAAFLFISAGLVVDLALRSMLPGYSMFILVACESLILFVFDRSGNLMIGDVGSNSLGALLGLSIAILAPQPAVDIYVALLAVFHIWTEKHSVSRLIELTPWLSRVDRQIGVRE